MCCFCFAGELWKADTREAWGGEPHRSVNTAFFGFLCNKPVFVNGQHHTEKIIMISQLKK